MPYSRYKNSLGAAIAIALIAQGCILLEDTPTDPTNSAANATSNNTANPTTMCTSDAECDIDQNEVCDGGVCVCPTTCPADFECGSFTPQCSGKTIACGTCDGDDTCDPNTLTCEGPGLCDLPIVCEEGMCGSVYDEVCDEVFNCGPCGAGETCDEELNLCIAEGSECPTACDDAGYECGGLDIPGCSAIECGACGDGMRCDDGICTEAMCIPQDECAADTCGSIPDGCGGELACGGCADRGPAGALCQQNQCRTPVIDPGPNSSGSYFGYSVAIANGRIAVGAPYTNIADGSNPTVPGQVYIYSLDDENKVSAPSVITSPDRAGFGASLALGDNAVAIGEPYGGADGGGIVRLYDLTQTPPQLSETLEFSSTIPSALIEKSHLGYSVAGHTVHLAAGAPNMAPPGSSVVGSTGAVQVWRKTQTGYVVRQLITPPSMLAAKDMRFGHSIKMTGGLLFVGAPGFRNGAGVVFIYRIPSRENAEITHVGQLTTGHTNIKGIGTSIDVETAGNGTMAVVVGARDSSNGAGAVLRYELSLTAGTNEFTTTEKDAFVPWNNGEADAIATSALGSCAVIERGTIIGGAPTTTNNNAREQGIVVAASIAGDAYQDTIKFTMPTPPGRSIPGAFFGSSCAATVPEGSPFGYLIVGAPHNTSSNAPGHGRAFIYRFDTP